MGNITETVPILKQDFDLGIINDNRKSTFIISIEYFNEHLVQLTISDIINEVVVRIEGSIDSEKWYNMHIVDWTYSDDGVYPISFNSNTYNGNDFDTIWRFGFTKYLRVTFIGGKAEVKVNYFGRLIPMAIDSKHLKLMVHRIKNWCGPAFCDRYNYKKCDNGKICEYGIEQALKNVIIVK